MKNESPESFLRKAREIGEDIKTLESVDINQAYHSTWGKIRRNRMKRFNRILLKSAAILALPLLLSSLVMSYLYFHKPEEELKYAEVKAAQGTIIRYELPDKSVVFLNSGSSLRYPTVFDDTHRSVDLEGEAYFHVTADQKRPFYVNTSAGLSVYVYGTHFNISAYKDDDFIETILEEGKVNVITPDKRTVVRLEPGERLSYNKVSSRMSKNVVDIYEKTAWKDGKLMFRNTSLNEVLKRLARHFNVNITFNNHSGRTYNYRATFRDETLPQILDYLGESATMKWQMKNAIRQSDDTFSKKSIIVDLY